MLFILLLSFSKANSKIPISVSLRQTTNNINFGPGCANTDCPSDPSQNDPLCGINCWSPNDMYVEYRFRGEQFAIYGSYDDSHGSFDIYLDGELHDTVSLYKNIVGQEAKKLVYTSEVLRYDDHTVKIQAKGTTIDLFKIVYWPSVKAIRLNSTEFDGDSGWTVETDQIGGYQEFTTDNTKTKSKTIKCSKIWVYGNTGPDNGDLEVKIDNEIIRVTEKSENEVKGVLLYETDPFEFNDHTITIKKADNSNTRKTYFRCIYYIPEPIALLPIPISVSLLQMSSTLPFANSGKCTYTKCNENVELNEPLCGYNCWEPLDMTLEYSFRGERFAIYGSKDKNHGLFDVTLDGKLHETVSLKLSDGDQLQKKLVYKSGNLKYGNHTVKIQAKGVYIDIFKLVYWPSVNSIRINLSSIEANPSWGFESDQIGGFQVTSNSKSNVKALSLSCSKMWIYGSTGPDYGDVQLQIDGNLTTISEMSDTINNGSLLYESEFSSSKSHTFKFRKGDDTNKKVALRYIYYTPSQVNYVAEPISVSLHQTTNNINFGPGCANKDCPSDPSQNDPLCGTNCWSPNNMYVEYRFRGEQFAIYGSYDDSHGPFDIYLDGELYDTASLYKNIVGQDAKKLVYTSKILRYDDHIVKIQAKGTTIDLFKIVYWPSVKAIRLNSTEFDGDSGWTAETDQIGGYQEFTTDNTKTKSKTIKCSKIWVYGNTGPNNGDLEIKIDNEIIRVTEKSENEVKGVLLYETDPFEYNDHTIIIKKADNSNTKKTYFRCIYYIPEPIALLPIPVSVSLRQTQNNITFSEGNCELNKNQCSDDITQDQTNCGVNCWGPSNFAVEYQFKGEKFAIYGSKDNVHGPIEIYLDGKLHDTIELYIADEISPIPKVRVYTSGILPYGDHTVKVYRKGIAADIYKIVYWPSISSIRINASALQSVPSWNYESDQIGGFQQYSTEKNSTKTTMLTCSKMWIYGSRNSNYGELSIQIDENMNTVNEQSATLINGSLLLESGDLFYENHKVFIKKSEENDKKVTLRYIYCEHITFPTPTPVPEVLEKLTCSFTDSTSNKLFSDRCDYVSKDGNKVTVEIFRSEFIDFKDEGDGGAIHIVNGELDCEKIEFRNCQSTEGGAGGAIFVDNSEDQQNHINLHLLNFISCRAGYGGALYLHSQLLTNPFYVSKCTFQSNEAYGTAKEDNLFGGSSIFLKTKFTKIIRCKFSGGVGLGGAVKILEIVDNTQLEEKVNNGNIHISDCSFVQSESSNSIFYVGKNDCYKVEIINCDFKGKLSKESFYIDGLLKDKSKPIFSIKSCTFDHEIKDSVKADFIEEKKQSFNNSYYTLFSSHYGLMIISAACVCLAISLIIIIKNKNNEQLSENNEKSTEL